MTQHTDLGQVDKVIVLELLQGREAAKVGRIVFHISHFRLLVSVRRQGAFSVTIHIQRHYHIPATAQLNGIRLHGIFAGGIAVAQQDCRGWGFRSSCFRDKELCVAGGADIGSECQLLGADCAACGLDVVTDDRGNDHQHQTYSQHNGGRTPFDRGFVH